MKKEEHLKILKKFETKFKRLEHKILKLSEENSKLKADLTISRAVSDQRALAINGMMKQNINNIKYMKDYDAKVQTFYSSSMQRMQSDEDKFNELKNYISKNFSQATIPMKDVVNEKQLNENLSQTLVGENGEIYTPQHVVDVAILIMEKQRKKLKDMFNDFDSNIDNEEE